MDSVAPTYVCDVLVIGAGVSGTCAAIQAGRMGCRTILVEMDAVLGGNSGPNLGVGITGADRYNPYGTETGVIHALQEEAAWVGAFTPVDRGAMPYNIARRYEAVVQAALEEAGVRVLKRHYARAPVVDANGRITAVIAEDMAAFRTVRIDVAHVVVEASGDGEIGVLAGADYDAGSEAQREFGERSAPAARATTVQGTSLVAIAYRTDHAVAFIPPPGTPPFAPRLWHGRLASAIHHHDGWFREDGRLRFLYITEAGGTRDTVRDDGAIYEQLLGQLWAEWDHIKNGPHREAARNWDLLWVSPKAGKRESRRLLGDVILTQTDLEAGRRFADDIAYGGHDLDDHRPLPVAAAAPEGGAGQAAFVAGADSFGPGAGGTHADAEAPHRGRTAFVEGSDIFGHSIPPMYGIPYRACYSRNVPNLLLAGRLISATHLAHSSTRLMRTGGAIGQAVGTAAALCCRYGCTPREVTSAHLDELQQTLLADDATLLGRRVVEAGDLAPRAKITASSEVRFNDQVPGMWVPLVARAGALLWDWPRELRGVALYLTNTTTAPQPLHLTVLRARREPRWTTVDGFDRHGRNDLRDAAFGTLAELDVALPAGHRGWFEVPFPTPLAIGEKDAASDDDRLIVAVDEARAVLWALAEGRNAVMELVEHSHHAAEWRMAQATPTLRLTPAPPLGEAANVANGYHRRFGRGPLNMWWSDPGAGLPQDLVLAWETPQSVCEVALTFDNLTANRHDTPWESGRRVLPFLVKAYAVEAWVEGAWRTLVAEACNVHRFRRHRFAAVTTTRLRLRVLATHGEGEAARVYRVAVSYQPSAVSFRPEAEAGAGSTKQGAEGGAR